MFNIPDSQLSQRGKKILLTGSLIHKYISVLFHVMYECGVEDKKLIAYLLLFLRCITPSYSNQDFQKILITITKDNRAIQQSIFIHSLGQLRLLCNGTPQNIFHLLYKYEIVTKSALRTNMIEYLTLFSTHLIENIIRYTTIDANAENTEIALFEGIERSVYITLEQANRITAI